MSRSWCAGVAVFLAGVAGLGSVGWGDPYAPPVGYYAGITATSGEPLKQQLHDLIDGHSVISYSSAVNALQILDEDPNDPARLTLIYTPWTIVKGWDAGLTWNREHTWPRSRGVDTSGPDNSDLHQLRPCDSSINSIRGNDPFGIGGAYWDPNQFGSADRGEIARSMFYMATRYEGDESSTTDLELVNGIPFGNTMGDLARLLEWHYEEMPDNVERRRNQYVYLNPVASFYSQGNRNPFIDRPEYVWAIWGTSPNDSRITLAGESPINGATSVELEAPPRLEGSPAPSWQVSLSKTGATPTTWEATASGDAFTDVELPRSFLAGARGATIGVGLNLPTGTGPAQGVVTIDNTDLTSSGAGQGSNDGDDTITLSTVVVAPSVPSLSLGEVQPQLVIDLGQVERLSGEVITPVPVANVQTDTYQAAMFAGEAAVTITGEGLTVAWGGATSVEAGDLAPLVVTLDTSAPLGSATALVTIPVSDDFAVVGGELRGELLLGVSAELVAGSCPGDVTSDGAVDGGDLLAVINSFGVSGPSAWGADASGDGVVDGGDLLQVINAFGAVCP